MKHLWIVLIFLGISTFSQAQFQAQADANQRINDALRQPVSTGILSFLSSDRFSMNHTLSASFMSFGNHSMMVNSYLNTSTFQLANPLSLQVRFGLMNTPYTSFETSPGLKTSNFFGGASLQYKPSENTLIHLSVDVAPNYYYPNSPYQFRR